MDSEKYSYKTITKVLDRHIIKTHETIDQVNEWNKTLRQKYNSGQILNHTIQKQLKS